MENYIYIVVNDCASYLLECESIEIVTTSLEDAVKKCMNSEKGTLWYKHKTLFVFENNNRIYYNIALYRGNVLESMNSMKNLPAEICAEMVTMLKPYIEEENNEKEKTKKSDETLKELKERQLLAKLKSKYE